MYEKIGQATDEEIARMIRAIQDLSLGQLRRRRDDGLAEYEIVINAIIDALRINHDNVGATRRRHYPE